MSEPEELRVGVVGGVRLPGNVRTFLRNVRRLLVDHPTTFDLELVVSDEVDPPTGYEPVDPGFGDPSRAVGTARTLTRGTIAYAESHAPDVLFQVTKFPLHGFAATVAGRRSGTPVLTRLAGDNFREFRLSSGVDALQTFGLNNVLGRVPVRWSDRVIVLGPHGRSQIRDRKGSMPIAEIPQPVDRTRFSAINPDRKETLERQLSLPPTSRRLLTIGRLTRRKGMDVVVETAEALTARDVDFQWYVLGTGPMRENLETAPGVNPLGRIEYDRVPAYYGVADLVVHPSRIEGLSNVLLEAAACGTPTISRDVGDCSTVASGTFDDPQRLPDLVSRDHDPVDLGERFDSAVMGERYARALIRTAREHA